MAKVERFGVQFDSSRELANCIGLKYARKCELTPDAIMKRLGVKTEGEAADFLRQALPEVKQSRTRYKREKLWTKKRGYYAPRMQRDISA